MGVHPDSHRPKLWTANSSIWKLTNVCAGTAALILAAIFFVVSSMVVRKGRMAGLQPGGAITLFSLPCLTMAIAHPGPGWLLAILVIVQQGMTMRLAMYPRVNGQSVLSLVVPICAVSLAWMLYGISHGHSEAVVLALLAEIYVLAGVDFWFSGWERSLGLLTTCTGLVAFGAVFPSTLLIEKVWPGSSAASDLFGISAFSVAIGMILIVLEEDARSARQTTEEYRLTFDTNPHPLWIFDTETLESLAVNEAACVKHGYTREEFTKLKLPDIVEERIAPEALGQDHLPNPNRASRHVRKNGTEMPMDVTAHNIVFRERSARFVLGIDVSEREDSSGRCSITPGMTS